MNFKIAVFSIVFFFLAPQIEGFAQVENNSVVEEIIESIAENADEDFDYSELTEKLHYYQKYPININKATHSQLRELVFLSPIQINALSSYIENTGPLLALYELQSIDGFDLKTIRMLLNFITIQNRSAFADVTFKNLIKNGSNDVIMRYIQVIEKQKGYSITDTSKSRYLGSPQKIFSRYRYHYGQNIAASLVVEKDAGEQFFNGNNKGFDFYSGNISFKNIGKISKLVVGDYSLQFGQGLTLWSGLSFGKGTDITTVAKQEVGLKPYTSVNEASFFRGLAGTLNFKRIAVTPFISYLKIDAGISEVVLPDDREEIASVSISGLHRTPNEISNRNSSNQLVLGGNVKYAYKNFEVGATAYHTSFERPFEPGKYLYNKFDFADQSLTNMGMDYSYSFANSYVFGELAKSLDGGLAYVNGIMSSLTPQVSIVLLHRNYQKNYHSFFNQAISEAGTPVNEKGFYTAISIKPSVQWEWVSYVDFFRFPWLRFGVDAPSKGYEILSQLSYTPNKRTKVNLRFKQENKEENDDIENSFNFLEPRQKNNYRAEISYKVNDNFNFKNRVEVSQYKKSINPTQFGYLIFQDVGFNPMQSKLSGNLRVALFDTDGYDTRIYTYENDVLYSYSFTAYQNRGLRTYINGQYTIKKGLDVWLRYAITKYTNVDKIGSGLDEINGNKKSDIRFQVRVQF